MWRIPIEGGQPEKVITGEYFPSAISLDGKLLAARVRTDPANAHFIAILAVEENSVRIVKEFKAAQGAELLNAPSWLRWFPDGKSIAYIVTKKGVSNLWVQPLDGGSPRQLTSFTSSRIYSFDFSPDGTQIICSRGELSGYIVLLTNQ